MAAGVLSWDIVARDKASAPLLRVAESADKTAAGTSKAAESMARLDASMAGLSVASDKQRAAALRQVAAQERVDSVMASSRVSVERLATAQANLIGAQRGVAAAQEESAVATGRFGGAIGGTLKMASQLGLMFGAFEVVKQAIDITKEANAFQRAMVQVQTNADVTAGEVNKATGALLDMAGPVAAAPADLATAWYHAKSVGLDYAKSIETTRIAAEGARVGNSDLEETMNALTSTVASGIPGVQDMSSAMGQLITIVGSGDMKLADLNEALGTGVLVRMKQYGLSLTDVGAALATFGDNNIRGADAATLLRMSVEAMAKQGAPGVKALESIGLKAGQLRDDLQKGGLNKAVLDLNSHLKAAGITGNQVGGFLIDAFTKKGGGGVAVLLGQVDRLESKFRVLRTAGASFGDKWQATTQTASFALASLGHGAEAAGIKITEKLGPSIAKVAQWFGTELPIAAHAASAILGGPLSVAWHVLGGAVEAAGAVLKPIVGLLNSPVGHGLAVGVLAMWAAFKGFEIAVAAGRAIQGAMFAMQMRAETSVAAFRTWGANARSAFTGMGADAATTSAVMQAEFAKIEQSAMQEAAAVDRAAAQQAEAYAVLVAAADDATATMIANSQNAAMAAQAQADATDAALLQVTAAADAAALEVDAAGEAAAVGWSAVLGPIGLVAVGVLAVVSMFHKSTSASKEATDAAKAYGAALSSGGKSDLVDAITKQLTNNDLPAELKAINDGLGRTAFTGQQFVAAIMGGSPALTSLRDRLQAVIKSGTTFEHVLRGPVGGVRTLSPAAQAAAKALGLLNTQYQVLSKTAAKDLLDTKTFAGAAGAIQKTTAATKLGTDAARQYATMAGLEVDKNGIVAKSQAVVNAAVNAVARAYATATQSGTAYLSALDAFSKSAGTSADRAALIGATLVAANGDALAYAGAMSAAAGANHTLVDTFRQQRQAITQAQTAMSKAKAGSVEYAQAQQQLSDALAQSELAAINLKTGTIDYEREGAGPLVQQLQAIQSAAMSAASATYQHARATEGGKKAADDAYKVYRSQTRGALIDEATHLGLTSTQAKKLADKYFGMPKKVKTLIEQEGANPVVDVLTKIGKMLAAFTGQPWDINVVTHYTQTGTPPRNLGRSGNSGSSRPVTAATGGYIRGLGTGTSDSIPAWLSNGEYVINAKQTSKHRGLLENINNGGRGFAAGGIVQSPNDGASGDLGATNGVGGPAIGELHLHYSHPDDYHRATATAMRAATTVLR